MPAGRKEKFLPVTSIGTKSKTLIRKDTPESYQFDKDKADTIKKLGKYNPASMKIRKQVGDTSAAAYAYARKKVQRGK